MKPFYLLVQALLLSLCCVVSFTQNSTLLLQPDGTYNLSSASAFSCYANCNSCQFRTNLCEDCFAPYFSKAQDGSCILDQRYTMQSSLNEIESGKAFLYSIESWSKGGQLDCQPTPSNFSADLRILGPFSSADAITYQRTLSFHDYFIIKFLLIQMQWSANSSLLINIADSNNQTLYTNTITYLKNIPHQLLCSTTPSDQRISVEYNIPDTTTTELLVTFAMAGPGSWGISTFTLITGSCDSTCQLCSFANAKTECLGCRNFLQVGLDNSCSICPDGFALRTSVSSSVQCVKCAIEYISCSVGSVCFYGLSLGSELNKTSCKFLENSNFTSLYDINQDSFIGSLFTVSNKPSTYQCSSISVVGLAKSTESITRIYQQINHHFALSITFNVLVLDQPISPNRYVFLITIDGHPIQPYYLNCIAISNLCGGSSNQSYTTYPATLFYQHNNTNNVNLTITSNAQNWGIRNLRIALQVCDTTTCLKCTTEGCEACAGYYGLKGLLCVQCPVGFGNGVLTVNNKNVSGCLRCGDNCLSCAINVASSSPGLKSTCLECSKAYYLYEGVCLIHPNTATPIYTNDASLWLTTHTTTNNTFNSSCVISLTELDGTSTNASVLTFITAENTLDRVFTMPQTHYKKIIQFYLLRIDAWAPGDVLNLYLNDLLVLSKQFITFGNNICFDPSETDLVSFESIEVMDDNSSVSVHFQVVRSNRSDISVRRFGVSQLTAYGVGCNCQSFDFTYKIQYNYDNGLHVHVQFSRVYMNSNPSDFSNIFWLYVGGLQINYTVISNNTVTFILQAFPSNQNINTKVNLICRYPARVQTDITNPVNSNPFFTARLLTTNPFFTARLLTTNQRLLQNNNNPQPNNINANVSNIKTLNNTNSQATLARYTPIDQPNTINGVRVFFEVVSRIVIYVGFFSFFIGCQTSCTHFMHNIQRLWVHIFIASLAIPSVLKYALAGFREAQNQNIAINPVAWQTGIPFETYYDAPPYYQEYYTDISFFRNIYNIGFAFAILIVFTLIANVVFKYCDFSRSWQSGEGCCSRFFKHMRITFEKRVFFIINSIIFYQYLTLVLASTLQFIDLKNRTNYSTFAGLNAAAAIVAFIFATIYPLFLLKYLYNKAQDMHQTNKDVAFNNRYGQIFYRFYSEKLWGIANTNESQGRITFQELIYNTFRFGQIWWLCIVVTLLYDSPNAQCYLLMITNCIHLVIVLFSSLNQTVYFRIMKVLELCFFIGLEILILVCNQQIETLTNVSFNTLGQVGLAFVFAILFLSFLRFVYTFWRLYKQYDVQDPMIAKIDNRRRNIEQFESFNEKYEPGPEAAIPSEEGQ